LTDVGIETLVGCGVEGVIAATTDGTFDKFSIGVGNPSMVAVARENSDAVKVGCGNFVMWLLDRSESFASSFNMVRS
jgi:hypothetical protein